MFSRRLRERIRLLPYELGRVRRGALPNQNAFERRWLRASLSEICYKGPRFYAVDTTAKRIRIETPAHFKRIIREILADPSRRFNLSPALQLSR